MKRLITVSAITLVFLISALLIFLPSAKSVVDMDADALAKRSVSLFPSSDIKNIDGSGGLEKADKILLIGIEKGRLFIYEFKDSGSAEKSMAMIMDSTPGESSRVRREGRIVLKYVGTDEEEIRRFNKL